VPAGEWLTVAIAALVAYLVGGIPFGFLIGRLRGIDIRTQGSRNIGATNVGRVLGRPWGLFCLVLDILKGLAPTLLFGAFFVASEPPAAGWLGWLLVGLAAVLGHLFPVYLGFKGGKGVATTIGVALGVYPHLSVAMVSAVVVYGLLRYATGIVSVGSLGLAVAFPIATAVFALVVRGEPVTTAWPLLVVTVLLSVLIIVRHRSNIQRLLRGEEQRMAAARRAESRP
jgi:acyl phosphate:glycerol-3-phosphate acyltransferase